LPLQSIKQSTSKAPPKEDDSDMSEDQYHHEVEEDQSTEPEPEDKISLGYDTEDYEERTKERMRFSLNPNMPIFRQGTRA
jgi:hypothetical protein